MSWKSGLCRDEQHIYYKVSVTIVLCIIIIIIIYSLEFVTSALADGFSLEFEWQQVSSSL